MITCWLSRCSLWLAVALFPLPLAHKAHAEVHNPEGTWATHIELPVKWRMNMALEGGSGAVRLYALLHRSPDASSSTTRFVETLHVCGIEQPPTKTLGLYGGERFSVDYQGDVFGPDATAASQWQASELEDRLQSEPLAVQIGIDLPSPLSTSWPRDAGSLRAHLLPLTNDDWVGARAASRTDGNFVLPPVDISASRRAHTFYIASRTALTTSVVFVDGDTLEGTASLATINGRTGLNTTIVGCETDDGGRCQPSDLNLTNSFQPSMRADGVGHARMIRVAADSDCREVRALFP